MKTISTIILLITLLILPTVLHQRYASVLSKTNMRIKIIVLLMFLSCNLGWAQVKKPVPMPQMQTVGEGVVWRISDNKDEHGSLLPPWKEIRITNIFEFKRSPVIGEKVTVIPLDADISPLDLRVIKAQKKENPCNERLPNWWEVELEPIKLKEFFEIEPIPTRAAEFPFNVAIIYPAVKVARQMKKEQLMRGALPKGVSINTVKAAIDLNDDRKLDVVIVEYCCGDTKKPADDCDYTCGKTFKKVRNSWKLIDTRTPC